MFESLSDRLSAVFRKFRGQGTLNESNIQDGLREVRLALLEADVNLKVVREFIERVREKSLGQDVLKNLNPAQQVVKIVHEELIELLGGDAAKLELAGPAPHIIMLSGLQGSGKTTSAGKLAHYLRDQGRKPYLVPADVYRPAAIDQLTTLAGQLDMPVYASTTGMNPVDIAKSALADAQSKGCDCLLIDTAGRLHIDETLMQELVNIKEAVNPQEILFVADAMTGQDAVNVAESFNQAIGITGVILTKMDGDARGGAALSIKSVTGKSVKFVGMGEKINELEPFFPDRIAGRILGMGDMLTLIEKAQADIDEEEAEELARKIQSAEFNFEDFRAQLRRMKNIGSLESILKMIPGMGGLRQKLGDMKMPEKELAKSEAIINSMTKKERLNPKLLSGSRKMRIAKGSGTSMNQVNQFLKQFEQMRSMMQKMSATEQSKGKGLLSKLGLGKENQAAGPLDAMSLLGGMGGMGNPGMGHATQGGGLPLSKEEQKKLRLKRKDERKRKKKKK